MVVSSTTKCDGMWKRRMVGDMEERIQIYTAGPHQDVIVTRRCYVRKTHAQALLTQAGFHGLQCTNGYTASAFRPLEQAETTASQFVCMASKPASQAREG